MTRTRLGVALWAQATPWASLEAAARRVDELGYDDLFTLDHLYAIVGDPYVPIFEAYATLGAWSKVTTRVHLGLLVGANTLRNPGVVARMLSTLDHASGGRMIAGLGGAWFDLEHHAHGIEFGSGDGERLSWLEESAAALRHLFDGEAVTSAPGAHYAFDDLRLIPTPVQPHLPILIGGTGERKTLRTVARWADLWNASGSVEFLRHKVDVLRGHCETEGRDASSITFTAGCKPVIRSTRKEARETRLRQLEANRIPLEEGDADEDAWIGTPGDIAERIIERRAIGFDAFIAEIPAPHDLETLERWIGEVRPLVEAA